jgi:hypothetical protein
MAAKVRRKHTCVNRPTWRKRNLVSFRFLEGLPPVRTHTKIPVPLPGKFIKELLEDIGISAYRLAVAAAA